MIKELKEINESYIKIPDDMKIMYVKGYLQQIKETREIYIKELKKKEWNPNGYKYKFLSKLLKNLEDQEKNIKEAILNEQTN